MTVDYDFDAERAKQVAVTTIDYLGGHRMLRLMVGAHNFTYDKEGTVRFQFRGSRKANSVEIRLNGSDLYDVRFYRAGKNGMKLMASFDDVFFDGLCDVFETATGLLTTM